MGTYSAGLACHGLFRCMALDSMFGLPVRAYEVCSRETLEASPLLDQLMILEDPVSLHTFLLSAPLPTRLSACLFEHLLVLARLNRIMAVAQPGFACSIMYLVLRPSRLSHHGFFPFPSAAAIRAPGIWNTSAERGETRCYTSLGTF